MRAGFIILFTCIISFIGLNTIVAQDSLPKKLPIKDTVKKRDSIIAPKKNTVDTSNLTIDSIRQKNIQDSLYKDSVNKTVVQAKKQTLDTIGFANIFANSQLAFNGNFAFEIIKLKSNNNKDSFFYGLVLLVFILALIKAIFPKYFISLFQLFIQSSFRQKQTREQLLQFNLASLLMNLLFVLSTSIFIVLVIKHNNYSPINFWYLLLYITIAVFGVYSVKYLVLLFSGWIFNAKELAETYLFIVFLVNKILGIVLIPFILIFAFSALDIIKIASVIAAFIILALLIYRYVASLGIIRNIVKVNVLHFFLYLCAVEVLPLLIMLKFVFNFIHS